MAERDALLSAGTDDDDDEDDAAALRLRSGGDGDITTVLAAGSVGAINSGGDEEVETAKNSKAFLYLVLTLLIVFVVACVALAVALSTVLHNQNNKSDDADTSPDTDLVDTLPLRLQSQAWNISQNHPVPLRFNTTTFTWSNVDVSPDGSTLVFDVLGDLYTVPIVGGIATPLRVGVPFDTQPRFSPKGDYILFRSDESGCDNVWRMNLQTREATQITDEPYRFINNAQWNPTGEPSIVAVKWFTSGRSIPAGEIWTFQVGNSPDTTGRRIVSRGTVNAQVGPEEPFYDPTATFVYYSMNTRDSITNWQYSKDPHAGIYSIFRINLLTNATEYVAGGVGGAGRPVVSHDGQTLAFVRRTLFNESLILRNLHTGDEAILYSALSIDQQETSATHGVYPQFSFLPDDSAIVIWSTGQLYLINTATGQATLVPVTVNVDLELAQTVRPKIDASYGTSFATKVVETASIFANFVYFTTLAQTYVYDKDRAERPMRVTPSNNVFEFTPSLSPSGRQLSHAVWNDVSMGAVEILTLNSTGQEDTGYPRVIVTSLLSQGRFVNSKFSPSGKALIFTRLGTDNLSGPRGSLGAGLYYANLSVNAQGLVDGIVGTPHRISGSTGTPFFSADGTQIYIDNGSSLQMITTPTSDGSVQPAQTLATGAYTTSIVISPNAAYAAFVEFDQVYITDLSGISLDEAALGVTAVPKLQSSVQQNAKTIRGSVDGGAYLSWSSDSQQLSWLLGSTLYTLPNVVQVLADCASTDDQKYGLACVTPSVAEIDLSATSTSFSPPMDRITVIENGLLVPMTNDSGVIPNGCVVITGNIITAIGPCDQIEVPSNPTTVIDAQNGVVMPGFIDAHAHWSGTYMYNVQQSYEFVTALAFGVTTMHNPSLDTIMGFSDIELVRAGKKLGPRMYTTGTILYGADGTYRCEITDLEEARTNLRRLRAYGAWSAKSYNQPCRSARQMILEAARELDFAIVPEGGMAFFWNLQQIIDGHTTMEHSIPVAPLYDDILTLFAASGTAYCPTFVVNYGGIQGERYWYQTTNVWENERLRQFTPTRELEGSSLRRVKADPQDYHHFKTAASVAELSRRGVNVQLGAHGQRDGIAYHWDLWMFSQGGLSNLEVLRATTVNAAHGLGLQNVGVLQSGFLSDIIIFPPDQSPLDNIFNSEFVQTVIIDGRVFEAASMTEIVGNERFPLPEGPLLNTPTVGSAVAQRLLRPRDPSPQFAFRMASMPDPSTKAPEPVDAAHRNLQ